MHGEGCVGKLIFILVLLSCFIIAVSSAWEYNEIPGTPNETVNPMENVMTIPTTAGPASESMLTNTISPIENESLVILETPKTDVTKNPCNVTPIVGPVSEESGVDSFESEETGISQLSENIVPSPTKTTDVPTTNLAPTPDERDLSVKSPGINRISDKESFEAIDWSQVISHGKSPVNPAFLRYQNRTKNPVVDQMEVQESSTPSGASLTMIELNDGSIKQVLLDGDIPSPIDLSYTQTLPIGSDDTPYPASYDLRSYGRVSSVKDQGVAGACWAFATIASLESTLLPGENWDFSENNMKNRLNSTNADGFDRESIDGGNEWMSSAYLTRWSGPVLESDDPYQALGNASLSGLMVYKHVQNVYFIPQRSSATDNNNIKDALMNHGAVKASIYWDSLFYNSTSHAFNNYLTASLTNHAITIVGWDDSYSRTNFKYQPAGDGAFIVKNSWGTGWGDNGYFYVSYYDGTIGNRTVVFTGERITNFDRVYSYDPLGWVGSYGYGTPSAYYANVFTAQSGETLNSISTYQTYPGSYTVRIYLDPSGGPINASGYVAETTWSDSLLGYHTIDIPDVTLKRGQKYSIVIFASTPGWNFPVPMENPEAYYSSHATANPGESYISQSGISWTDMTSALSNTNVCIKGYTTLKTNVGIYRPSTHMFYLRAPGSPTTAIDWGISSDIPVTGDWDGNGISDVG
ncbi:lectin like domain-containing protein, partial [Methanoregula sp. PtaB.Bin085]|uniref:lectin like domain-containing protein n=1 Tax=Methanoregula sp. PtaB.Bin085 TaxID=1811680 RepID=UPI0025C44924